jgi:protein-S-isoprenylcysteine O-methyltransferase Ste14
MTRIRVFIKFPATMLLSWLTPTVSQNSLAIYIGATIYTLVGAYFGERKLLRDFGKAYAGYKRKMPC